MVDEVSLKLTNPKGGMAMPRFTMPPPVDREMAKAEKILAKEMGSPVNRWFTGLTVNRIPTKLDEIAQVMRNPGTLEKILGPAVENGRIKITRLSEEANAAVKQAHIIHFTADAGLRNVVREMTVTDPRVVATVIEGLWYATQRESGALQGLSPEQLERMRKRLLLPLLDRVVQRRIAFGKKLEETDRDAITAASLCWWEFFSHLWALMHGLDPFPASCTTHTEVH